MMKTCSLLALAFATFACTAPYVGDEPSSEQAGAITASGGTSNIVYLGSQDFLYQCAGSTHTLGCGDLVRSIPDTQPYFAAPWATSTCRQWFTFRKGDRCIEAQRLERSDSHHLIEGNPALFEGLGLAHSDGASCRGGSGSASGVTITPGRHCSGADSSDAESSANGSKSGTDDTSTDTNGKGDDTGNDPGNGKGADPGTGTDDGNGNGKGSGSDDGSGKK